MERSDDCGELKPSLPAPGEGTPSHGDAPKPRFGHTPYYEVTCFEEIKPGDTVMIKKGEGRPETLADVPDELVVVYVDYEYPATHDAFSFAWEFVGVDGPYSKPFGFNRWDIEKVTPLEGAHKR